MIEMQTINLSMMDEINGLRARYGHSANAHAFQCLLVWADTLGFSAAVREDSFLVRYGQEGVHAWVFPCGSDEGKARFIREVVQEDPHAEFYFLREEDVCFLNERMPGEYEIVPTPENSEYLYDAEKYASLAGGAYMRIRNRVHAAEKRNHLTVVPVTEENIQTVRDIEKWWIQGKGNLRIDKKATERLIQYWSSLKCEGVIVLVDGKPRAVAAGYPLSEDTFDYALSKADVSVKGLSDYCKHALAQQVCGRYRLINGEDDLGIEGLRHMKELMRPVGKIEMYKAIKKEPV